MEHGADGLRIASVVVALLLVVGFGWYVISGQSARRRGAALARLSLDLVRSIGNTGRVAWLRGGGTSFTLQDVGRPFSRVQVVARPAPNSIVPFLADKSRDPRDLVAFAIDLARPPSVALEVVEATSTVGLRARRRAARNGWRSKNVDLYSRPLLLLAPDLQRADDVLRRAPKFPGGEKPLVVRLAVSPTTPHVSLTIAEADRLTGADARFGAWLSRLAEAMAKASSGQVL